MPGTESAFLIDLKEYRNDDAIRLTLASDPSKPQLTAEQKSTLLHNIQLLRDALVLFTATGAARGVSGHTQAGGAYDTIPEVCILLSLFEASEKYLPIVFDEAGMQLNICIFWT
ncbi:hypothetical protein P692DRAFT_2067743 [Suillus brevipes Sb2]|nr:hypothetical protein P692DRAFT_2067743 [Suillus brevipes Sb2]